VNITTGNVTHKRENGIIMFYNVTFTSLDWPDTPKSMQSRNYTHDEANLEIWKQTVVGAISCPSSIPEQTSAIPLTFMVDGLVPYTNYQFNITACNHYACALPSSETVTVVTSKTLPDIPACFPNITSFFNTSSTSVVVEWSNLTHHCRHGYLVDYWVGVLDNDLYWEWVENKTLIDVNNVPGLAKTSNESYGFVGLRNYWNYSVFIVFENSVGLGPTSDLIWTFTDEDSKLNLFFYKGLHLKIFRAMIFFRVSSLLLGFLILQEGKFKFSLLRRYADDREIKL